MRPSTIQVDQFTGANYNPSRTLGRGWFTDDYNSSVFLEGAWRPRRGLARAGSTGITTIGQQVLAIAEHRGANRVNRLVAIQANGNAEGEDTPAAVWTD